MIHSPIAAPPSSAVPPTDDAPRLRPAAYLRLRREAAGLSVEDVATMLAPLAADRPAAHAFVRLLEVDQVVARKARPIRRLAACYPVDLDVYFQLAGPAPHPCVCHGCGASTWDGWDEPGRGPRRWVTPTRCSYCQPAAEPVA